MGSSLARRASLRTRGRFPMTRLAALVLALAAAGPACGPVGTPPVEGIVSEALSHVERAPATSNAPRADAVPAATYREILRGDRLTLGAELEPGARELRLVAHEHQAGGRDVRTRAWTLTSELAIDAVSATAAWDLLVAGVDPLGEDVLERWRIEAWSSRSDMAPLVHREVIARGLHLGGARLIVCPPPGACALVLAKDGSALVEVPLQSNSAPTRRFDAETLPALRNACSAFLGEHLDAGRVITFDAPASAARGGIDRAVFVDHDRDGWIDESSSYPSESWAASPFQGAVWLSTQRVEAR